MATTHSTFFLQSTHGSTGNFELMAPRLAGGGADHFWRNNDDPALPWIASGLAFGSPDDVYALSVIQGPLGAVGNLEVVALEGSQLVHHWRDDGGTWKWQARTLLPGSVPNTYSVALIQSSHGTLGNYEVVAPVAASGGGGLAHWWRDNDTTGYPWSGPTYFASGSYEAVAMLQNSGNGNLEVLARAGNELAHLWRDDGGTWAWNGPDSVPGTQGVAGQHTLLQGAEGNFEVIAPLASGGLAHFWRDNSDPALSWHGPTPFGAGQVDAVAAIESSFGNLEVVARVGKQFHHYWRNSQTGEWNGPNAIVDLSPPDPTVAGASEIPYKPPIVAIHAALAHTGKLALWSNTDFDAAAGIEAVLNLTSGASYFPAQHHHLFCSGHAMLPDGRVVIIGGHMEGVTGVHVFWPDDDFFEHVTDMQNGRWYPTCTALPNGQVLAMSGTMGSGGPVSPTAPVNNTLQLFDPVAGLQGTQPLPEPFSSHFPPDLPTIDLYPFVYVLPSGELLVHSRMVSRFLDWTTMTWSDVELVAVHPFSRTYPGQGSSVLLPLRPSDDPPYRPRVLLVGGGGADPQDLNVTTPATNTVELLDLGEPSPAWRYTAPMTQPRVMPDAVLLPDGTVLVTSGSATGRSDMGIDPVLPIEVFDPVSETWTTVAPMFTPRSYHATAILLPGAQVLMGGKDFLFNLPPYDYPEHRLEIFSPPYLFRGARPAVSGAPTNVGYGATFTVHASQPISTVVLMRPGSVTHSYNMEQRLVGLDIEGQVGNQLTLQAPPNANIAPPGYYMLFVLNADGVPSEAVFVQLT
jgi:Domain of unknown function (DUF1929)/Glyoxal oxidase N-terminus